MISLRDRSMHEPELPGREELPHVNRRLVVLTVAFGLVLALFAAQIYKLTILRGPYYRDLSENNFMMESSLLAPRGQLLDREGRPLAVNQTLFDVDMSPFRLNRHTIQLTVNRLSGMLGRPELRSQAEAVHGMPRKWKSRTLAAGVTLSEALPVLEQSFSLPGVMVNPLYRRYYPDGAAVGPITGHVGRISPERMAAYRERGYHPNENIGLLGAERTFEALLRGREGREIVYRDTWGRPHSSYISLPAQPGHTVKLTIDLELQRLCYALLEGWSGVIVVMDPRDGAIRAMAARPSYDPNRPWEGSSYNRVTRGVFQPGSIFKPISALAALHAGFSPEETVFCDGTYRLPNSRIPFPCHYRWGHGFDDLPDALKHSCNVYFYRMADRLGATAMTSMASAFGFGVPTDFELTPLAAGPQEAAGTLARPGIDQIYPGMVLQMAIGQGRMIGVTPLQMARAYAALANGGTLLRPRILEAVIDPDGQVVRRGEVQEQGRLPLTGAGLEPILEGLRRVVYDRGGQDDLPGTASRYNIKPEWEVRGKTGTAETGRPETDAWFACFAPASAPELVIVVLVEESGHGGEMAAPLARQILAWHFGEPEAEIKPPVAPEEEQAPGETEDTEQTDAVPAGSGDAATRSG